MTGKRRLAPSPVCGQYSFCKMLGRLNQSEIETVLHRQSIGRIGYHADGKVHIVPVVYAYDGVRILCHSREGQKIRAMRANPNVCFEVEQIDDLTNWQSVVAWGTYEELTGDAAALAIGFLVDALTKLVGVDAPPGASRSSITPPGHGAEAADAVVYCLHLSEKTGRFERQVQIKL